MRKTAMVMATMLAVMPVAASAMTVAEFLAKTQALRAKGLLAVGSPDIALLRDEVKAAATGYRAALKADIAAGRKPSSCPPPVGQSTINSNDVIAYFSSLPPQQRQQTVAAAFPGLMAKKYPCR